MMTKWQKFVQSGAFARSDNLSLFLDSVTSSGPTSFGIIVAIILFVIVNQIWRLALGGAWPSSPSKPLRFVYVNDKLPPQLGIPENSSMYLTKYLLKDSIVRAKYLNFAQANSIVGQFLGVGYFLDEPTQIGAFLADCKNAGIRTSFMCAETSDIGAAKSSITKTLNLVENLDYSLWPETIQTNMEGFSAGQNVTNYLKLHLETKKEVATVNAKHGSSLRLAASVGWWWNSSNAPLVDLGLGKIQPYCQALLDNGVDAVPQIYLKQNADWQKEVFAKWVGFAGGTQAHVFPAIWINRVLCPAANEDEQWIPSEPEPKTEKNPNGKPGLASSQVENRLADLAKISATSGIDPGSTLFQPSFGGIAVFDAVSYSAFIASPPL